MLQWYSAGGTSLDPHLTYVSVGPPIRVGNPNGISIGSVIFAQLTAERPYTLHTSLLTTKLVGEKHEKLEVWANAQRDGRPAEYRWRPLFNAAKFG